MMNLGQAKELQTCQYWQWVRQELDYRILSTEKKLRSCDKDELEEIQTRLFLYEELKRLPEDVVSREESASDTAANRIR